MEENKPIKLQYDPVGMRLCGLGKDEIAKEFESVFGNGGSNSREAKGSAWES